MMETTQSTGDDALFAQILIDLLGGTSKVAYLCDVKPPSISGWKQNGIPKARRMYIRAVRPAEYGQAEREVLRDKVKDLEQSLDETNTPHNRDDVAGLSAAAH